MKHCSCLIRVGRLNSRSSLLMVLLLFIIDACVHEPFMDPNLLKGEGPTIPGCVNNGDVCFESSVLPIFLSSCARSNCHDSKTAEEGYVLDSYTHIASDGISPGNARESKLYKVLFADGEDQMPPDAPLTQPEKDSIAAWINQGAKNTTSCNCFCDTTSFTYAAAIQPILNNSCIGCHKTGSLGGNINLSTYAYVETQVANGKLWGSITHAAGYAPMPQGGKLSDCQITQVKKWIDSGALNN
jgi:hypothetical protein